MAELCDIQEQLKQDRFSDYETLAIFFGTSKFDAVLKKD